MARQTTNRRTYKRRPGLKEAAAVLDVSFSHLRRVLDGERQSRSLVSRFKNLLRAPSAPESESSNKPILPVPVEIAAAENFTPYFFATLARLGLQVVSVRLPYGPASPATSFPDLKEQLDQELRAANAGQFDSDFYTGGAWWFFYHVTDLGKAMRLLKTSLEARGLLPSSALLHAETATTLRVWHPATAALVEAETEGES